MTSFVARAERFAGGPLPRGLYPRYAVGSDFYGQARYFVGFRAGLFEPLAVPEPEKAQQWADRELAARAALGLTELSHALAKYEARTWFVLDLPEARHAG